MKNLLIFLYIMNGTLLTLHEIESAYEKEWEILRIPVKITGFLLLHVPIFFIIFYGLFLLCSDSPITIYTSCLLGLGGIVPFIVHKLLINRKEHFNKPISNIIIYSNLVTGIIQIAISIKMLLF